MHFFKETDYRASGYDVLQHNRHYHHGTIEIIQCLQGSGRYLLHDQMLPMVSGALYFIDGDRLHCSLPELDTAYCRNKLSVETGWLRSILRLMDGEALLDRLLEQKIRVLEPYAAEQADRFFGEICTMTRRENLFSAANYLFRLLRLCEQQSETIPNVRNEWITAALQYINTHLDERFTETDLCTHLHISQSHLNHSFKKSVKMSVIEYARTQRMIKAGRLLKDTALPVNEVAAACGYHNAAHFCASFKQTMRQTPLAYRNSFQEE